MNKTLISYADAQMTTSQTLCHVSAVEKGGVTKFRNYSPFDIELDHGFYQRNKSILESQQRGGGFGYWLWKPYICELVAREGVFNDYVIYADAGVEFINSVDHIIDRMERENKDLWLFGNGHKHIEWCKHSVLRHMLPGGFNPVAEQVQASVIIFKITPQTRVFMRRWLAWSEIPGFIDDSDCIGGGGFKDHRNDQSILTCLAIWDGIPLHWWPAQYGHHLRGNFHPDNYPQLFYHHRYRELDWKNSGFTIQEFMKQPKNV